MVSLICLGYPYIIVSKMYAVIEMYYYKFIILPDCFTICHLLGASLFLVVLLNYKPLQDFFERSIFLILGKYSFWIYLLHWTLLLGIAPVL